MIPYVSGSFVGALVGAVVLVGCNDADRCTGDCPSVAGVFQIDSSTEAANPCSFTPWLLQPTVQLAQSTGDSEVRTALIDPVNQVQVDLVGQVLRPTDPDDSGLGVFQMRTQTHRQRSAGDNQVSQFQLYFNGTVKRDEDGAHLSATLTTIELGAADSSNCQTQLSVVGRDASTGITGP